MTTPPAARALAYHFAFSAYGFWLPNDPRGSYSTRVAAGHLQRFGPATTTAERRSLARRPHDRAVRLAAKAALKHPPAIFTDEQIRSVGWGFADAAAESGYRVFACAILPSHVHLVLARPPGEPKRLIGHFKSRATHALKRDGLWEPGRPVWTRKGGWTVYLDAPRDVRRAVRYVRDNPEKDDRPPQRWWFETAPPAEFGGDPAAAPAVRVFAPVSRSLQESG